MNECPYLLCHHNHPGLPRHGDEGGTVTEAAHPAFAQGREHHQDRNAARESCPPADAWTYDPSAWQGYTVMYDRGWNSVEDVPVHSCRACRPQGEAQS